MAETLLQKLTKAAQLRQLEKHSKDSLDWFQTNARKIVGRERAQTLLINQQKKAEDIGKKAPIGKMFSYAYDPHHKPRVPHCQSFLCDKIIENND